jgi:hypothetical protein
MGHVMGVRSCPLLDQRCAPLHANAGATLASSRHGAAIMTPAWGRKAGCEAGCSRNAGGGRGREVRGEVLKCMR